MRKKQNLTNLKAINCCEVPPNGKLIYLPGQFENSVFVIVGD